MKQLIPLTLRKTLGNWWHDLYSRHRKTRLLRSLEGTGVQCNICGWGGKAFTDDHWHPGSVCPNCGSQVRHRLFTATLDGQCNRPELAETQLLMGKVILHFAPERQLRERLRRVSRKHTTADFDRGDCDLKLDMSSMPSIEDSSFDVVIACDVLEHVPDDLAAMRELHRILRSGGVAILSVPQMDSPAMTDQDPTVRSEADREKRFGQKDHVRMYGDDFIERLRGVGFEVDVITDADFKPDAVSSLVLRPPVRSPRSLATNERRIYFAKKSKNNSKISAHDVALL